MLRSSKDVNSENTGKLMRSNDDYVPSTAWKQRQVDWTVMLMSEKWDLSNYTQATG